MSFITVTGVLTNPSGAVLPNYNILFEAIRTSDTVINNTDVLIVTNSSGGYSFELGYGTYTLKIKSGREARYSTVASNILIYSTGLNNNSIQQIILAQEGLEDINIELIDQFLQIRADVLLNAQNASTSETNAAASAASALTSKNAAATSATSASSSATTATTKATEAASSATSASSSAATATTKASEAASSATSASSSATTATTKASEAATSATTAITKATEAATSATTATTSETNAAASATTATTKATEAATSATSAANSATSAATSASTATTKAAEAAASATSAATSASNAATSATTATTKATEAANSATSATNSATSAATSASTATTKATEAAASASSAATSASNAATSAASALTSKNAAATSETNAASSASSALASENAAATSATSASSSAATASTSATSALASKNAAATSETNSAAHEAAALASKNAAAISETNSANSAAAALASKNAAALSETNSANSAASALASKNAAALSETNSANSAASALSHKNAAGVSATAASDSQASAALSAANAGVSEAAAAASAAKAQQYATIVASALIFRGGWSAAGGVFPTPNLDPETSDYYRITVGGTMTGTQGSITVTAGDFLHWDMDLDQWFKVDAVDAVTSVAGRTGDVTLTKTDVGLANVPNTDATNASNITSGTLAAARLPASINAATTGNAATATKLATARTINGVLFDGSVDITTTANTTNTLTLGTGLTGTSFNGSAAVTAAVSYGTTAGTACQGNDSRLSDSRPANGGNSDTVDNLHASSFLRSDAGTTFSGGVLNVTTQAGSLGSNTGFVNNLQISQATANTDAFQTFHISGDHAVHFGLDGTTNDLFVGGWSAGAVKNKIWHAGNDGSGSGLDADLLDGYDSSRYSRSAVATFGGGDWNTMDTHGTYKIQHDNFNSDTNQPPAFKPYGLLVVDVGEIGGEARVLQVYYPHNTTDKYIYQRMRNNGVWDAWRSIWRGGTGNGSGLIAEKIEKTVTGTSSTDLINASMADNDKFRVRVGGTASNAGWAEIATADDGDEPIYVRQYTGEFTNIVRTLTLLDGNGNTTIPGNLYLYGGTALVEYGSNGSGEYYRFADGTQICSRSVSASAQHPVEHSFAAAFVTTPITIISNDSAFAAYASSVNIVTWKFAFFSSTTSYSVRVIAIGRWK